MKGSVGSFEARTHRHGLLAWVAHAARIIPQSGAPIAQLVPVEIAAKQVVTQVVEEIPVFRGHRGPIALTIRELIEEGPRS
jgi:hypothetical protein